MKTLIITEKPSVARDIRKALGTFKDYKDYYENEHYIISWAVGHLVELYEPEDYDKKYRYWALSNLPIIPEKFKLKVIETSKDRFKKIKKLINRDDIDTIVNACDAGREGELIFRNILALIPHKEKKIKRLWLSAMTEEEIIKEFKNLHNAGEFDLLGISALVRTEGDWLVGINATRAFTRRWGILLSIGRVQTPTLNIICEREQAIREFKPEKYYELNGFFKANSYEYQGIYVDKKGEQKIKDSAILKDIVKTLKGKSGFIKTLSRKETKTPHPLLYDLNELQRDANKQFGYTAQKTLNIAQKLYEEKKLITYPRTDSRFLPSALKKEIDKTLKGIDVAPYKQFVEIVLSKPIRLDSRVINDKGVTDHFAIIPTGNRPQFSRLTREELNLFDLIAKRFLSVFFEDAKTEKMNFETVVEGETFKTQFTRIKNPGWMTVYNEKEQEKLPDFKEGMEAVLNNLKIEEKETQPPSRFTDATLLSQMEHAGKLVEEEELKEALKEKGLGTPATRASIIERLVEVGYIDRVSKSIFPTDKGMRLIDLASEVNVEEVLSPTLTGEWEKKLIDIEKGKYNPDKFLEGIIKLTKDIVEKVKNYKGNFSIKNGNPDAVGICPKCGGHVYENLSSFECENKKEGKCDFVIWKKLKNRTITRENAVSLLKGENIKVEKVLSKNKRYFTAELAIKDGKVTFVFPERNEEITNPEELGDCPRCKGKVYEGKETYFCNSDNHCNFYIKKVMGNRTIERDEVKQLLKNGRTDLLQGFKSKKGRPFSATLYIDKNGSAKFEFEKKTGVKKGGYSRRRK